MKTTTKNRDVWTDAVLIATEPSTGASLKVGAILYDSSKDSDFILLRNDIDYKAFADPRYGDSPYIRITIKYQQSAEKA